MVTQRVSLTECERTVTKSLLYAWVEESSALDHKKTAVTLVVDEPEPRKLSRDWFATVRAVLS